MLIGVVLYCSISILKCYKILSNSTCPMIHYRIIIDRLCIYIYILYCRAFSGKLVMATGLAMPMLINLHLIE